MPQVTIDPRDTRAYTNGLLELVEDCTVGKGDLIEQLLRFLSESEVKQFCQLNIVDDDGECLIGPEEDGDTGEDDDEDELVIGRFEGSGLRR